MSFLVEGKGRYKAGKARPSLPTNLMTLPALSVTSYPVRTVEP